MKVSHPFHLADEDNKMTMNIRALLPLGYLLLFTGMVLTVIPLLRKGRTREQ